MILLPYVITVVIHGTDTSTGKSDWETFLLGELAEEISGNAPLEAVKAQAVIARTRIYKCAEDGETDENLYVNPQQAEKIWGSCYYEEYYAKFKEAIQSTEHQVLMYENQLIDASYHQLSAGSTRSAEELDMGDAFAYLQGKECSHDSEAEAFEQETVFSMEELEERLDLEEGSKDIAMKDIVIKEKDSAGYALTVQIGTETMTGEAFRNKLELASSCMEISARDEELAVTTKGIGHGLGLSQYAAQKMAEEGTEYREILEYFYTGTQIADGGELQK